MLVNSCFSRINSLDTEKSGGNFLILNFKNKKYLFDLIFNMIIFSRFFE